MFPWGDCESCIGHVLLVRKFIREISSIRLTAHTFVLLQGHEPTDWIRAPFFIILLLHPSLVLETRVRLVTSLTSGFSEGMEGAAETVNVWMQVTR